MSKIVRTKQAGDAWATTVEPEGGSGDGVVLVATKHLSSADLLTLDTTSVEIIPAPGSGRAIFPTLPGAATYRAGATPYTCVGGNPELLLVLDGAAQTPGTWGPGDLYFLNANGLLDQATDMFANYVPDGNGAFQHIGQYDISEWENLALVMEMFDGNSLTDGDGTLDIVIPYSIITL